MNTDTLNKSITRHVRINIGGDDKAKIPHPIKWEYAFPCNNEKEAEIFLSFRAYAYAARGTLHEDALNGIYTKDSPALSQKDIRALAIECVTSPDEARGGGGGGNPALASKAAAFAGLVKSGKLARAVVIPLLATGKATTEEAETALDKAIAKLAA